VKLRWVHIVPLAHLLLCFLAASGYILPALQSLGILFSVLVVADFPISAVFVVIALGTHGALAFGWLLVAGTAWWYFLSIVAEKHILGRRKRG
jgi:hypothetical protein